MKPNRFLRVAAVLLIITLPTFAFMSTTMARYTARAQANATARVAAWDPTFTHTSGPSQNNHTVLFTPRASGNVVTYFNLQNNSEVSCRYYSTLVLTHNTNNGYASWSVDNVAGASHDFPFHSAVRTGRLTYHRNAVTIGASTALERRYVRLSMTAAQID